MIRKGEGGRSPKIIAVECCNDRVYSSVNEKSTKIALVSMFPA